MRVRIPFDPRFEPWLMESVEICTPRIRRYASVGDHFFAFRGVFDVVAVDYIRLGDVVERLYRESGFRSPDEFIAFWERIHPIRGYRPSDKVFLHFFHLRDGALADTVRAKNWCPFCPYDYRPDPYAPIPCEHFRGYAGEVIPDPNEIQIAIRTPVSVRIYGERKS